MNRHAKESPPQVISFKLYQIPCGHVMRLMTTTLTLVWAMGLALLTACSPLQAPRFTYPTVERPVIPLSVKLFFDESVRSATVEQTVCANVLWKGRLGDAIVQSFSETGRVSLAQLTVEDLSGTIQPTIAPTSEVTAFITLTRASFSSTSRSGSDDNNYLAQFDVRLKATLQDAQGRRFPDAPMVYSNRIAVWAPPISGSDQCATGQLDAAVQTAAGHLASQLMGFLRQLKEKTQGERTAGRQDLGTGPSLVALEVTLLDENNNLVLERGEKVGVRIDVTNTARTTLSVAGITLSGTPTLIDTFAGTLSPSVRMFNLKSGETKSTILWGTLPANAEESHGELTVTVIPSGTENSTPATQTLKATMASRGAPMASMLSSGIRPASATAVGDDIPNRYGVIVKLSQYQHPWQGWQDGLSFDTKETLSLFAEFLQVPEGQTLLLQDELATQIDINDALALWLTKRVTKDSIVFFYFAGHARTNLKTGEIFLMPYDTTPQSSLSQLIPLRLLQNRLRNLGARLIVAIIEGPLAMGTAGKDGTIQHAAPNWIGDLDGSSGVETGTIIQLSRRSQIRQSLLSGLTGKADFDENRIITVGEWLRSLRPIAVMAPTLPPDLAVQSIPLSRVNRP
jgi:hypothetical protein